MKTFAEFLASAVVCADLRVPFPDLAVECEDPRPGVIFAGGMYVEGPNASGEYSVDLYSAGVVGTLEECASALYGWALTECPGEMGVQNNDVAYAVALATHNRPGATDTIADFVSECGHLTMQHFQFPDLSTETWDAIEDAAFEAGHTFAPEN